MLAMCVVLRSTAKTFKVRDQLLFSTANCNGQSVLLLLLSLLQSFRVLVSRRARNVPVSGTVSLFSIILVFFLSFSLLLNDSVLQIN